MTLYHHIVEGNIIASTGNGCWFPYPVVVCEFVIRRTHRYKLYESTNGVPFASQDHQLSETMKREIQQFSIVHHRNTLRDYVYRMLEDMNADHVPALWGRMARSFITTANALAQKHDRMYSISVKLELEIYTHERICLSNRLVSESIRQKLMETAFRAGSDDNLDGSCSICLNEFRAGRELIKTACDHIFDKECIFHWLEIGNSSCPLCRFQF